MGNRFIFLDVDGVLNWFNTNERVTGTKKIVGIEDQYVNNLKIICDENDAKIVLSSSWRKTFDSDDSDSNKLSSYLTSKLDKYNIKIYGYTPWVNTPMSWKRGEEIISYLVDNEYDNYIIIDDEEFNFKKCGIIDRLLKTSFLDKDNHALNESMIPIAKRLFNIDPKIKITREYLDSIVSSDDTYIHNGIRL